MRLQQRQPLDYVAFEQIKKKHERFLEDTKEILQALDTHYVYQYVEKPSDFYKMQKALLDDIEFVGKTIRAINNGLHQFTTKTSRTDLINMNLAYGYKSAYRDYLMNVRYSTHQNTDNASEDDINKYLDSKPFEHSKAHDKAIETTKNDKEQSTKLDYVETADERFERSMNDLRNVRSTPKEQLKREQEERARVEQEREQAIKEHKEKLDKKFKEINKQNGVIWK